MKRMSKFSLLGSAFLLSACGGVGYALENYTGVQVQRIEANAETWQILDKPEEGRMMITPSIGRAAAVGAAQGATFDLSDGGRDTFQEFRAVAATYLGNRDDRYSITNGALVVSPQYEFSMAATDRRPFPPQHFGASGAE